jgi:hypothetical protein
MPPSVVAEDDRPEFGQKATGPLAQRPLKLEQFEGARPSNHTKSREPEDVGDDDKAAARLV